MLSRLGRILILRTARPYSSRASIFLYGDIEEVEEKYHLPETMKQTARIVKVLYESEKPLNSHQLWEKLWDTGEYQSKMQMKKYLRQLQELKYVVAVPSTLPVRAGDFASYQFVYTLTFKAKIPKEEQKAI